MTHEHDLGALARSIIDSNRYMTLGTAKNGRRMRVGFMSLSRYARPLWCAWAISRRR